MKKIYLFLGLLLFTVMGAFAQNTCSYVFYLHDGYGDGWNNAKINVKQGNTVVQSVTFTTYASDNTVTVTLNEGLTYDLVWVSGNYDDECSFEVTYNGITLFTCSDATELPSGSFFTFTGCSTCFPPSPFAVAVSTSDVDLAWHADGNTQWEYTYGATNFDPDGASASISTTTDTFVNVSGLNTGTNYDFYIRSICDPTVNQVSAWKKYVISMPQNSVGEIPYSTGFETGDDGSNWTIVNGSNPNKWYIGTAAHSTGSRALYISDNNGNTYSYDGYDESNVWAYRDIDLGTNGTDHMLSFDWKCEGYGYFYSGYEEYYDYMDVYIGVPVTVGNGAPVGATFLGRYMNNTSWQRENVLINNQLSGVQRLYFHWINSDYTYSTSYLPAAVDNISITEINCGSIDSVVVSAITSNSVTITPYTSNGASDYVLYYKKVEDATYDSVLVFISSDYTLQNLSSGTAYEIYMKVDCSNDNYGFPSNVMVFTTQCDYITAESLPYTEGFEAYASLNETFPTCWHGLNTYSGSYPYPYITTSENYTGSRALYFYASSSTYNLAALPEIDPNLDVNTLTLSFMIKGYNSYYAASYNAIVGVMDSVNDLTTFVPVDTVVATSATNWNSVEVSFDNYTGNGKYIAILNKTTEPTYTNNIIFIDDVVLYVTSDCRRPTDVTASNIQSDSVTLTWTPQGTETSWMVVVVPAGTDPDAVAYTPVTSNTVSVGDLLPITTYDAYVKADCGNETSIWTAPCQFTTGCGSYSVPFIEDFDALQMPPTQCWEMATGYLDIVSTLTSSTYGWSTSSTEIISGNGACAYINIFGTSRDNWLISPTIDLGDGSSQYQIEFDTKLTNYYSSSATDLNGVDDIFAVVVSTDNGQTWSKTNAFIWDNDSTSNSYGTYNDFADVVTHFEIPLVDNNNLPYSGLVRIALYGESTISNADNNLYIDNFAVNPLTSCRRPTQLSFSNITQDQVTVSWTPGSTETEWNVVIVPSDSDMTTGIPEHVTDTFNTFSNLLANTNYKIYLQADCGSGETSGYVIGVVRTLCSAIDSLPFFEGFENYTANGSGYPDCWSKLSVPTGNDIYVYNYNASTGNRDLAFSTYAGETNIAILPQFDPTLYPLNTLQVSFNLVSTTLGEQFIVGYITNPMDASTFVGLDTIVCSSTYVSEYFDTPLNQCTATNAQIAFKATANISAYSSSFYLDDVQVDMMPDCPNPSNLHVTSTTLNSIDVAWTPRGNENEWEVAYDVIGFDVDNATPTTVYNPSFTATNLYDTLTYDFYVRAVCGVDGVSSWRGPVTVMPGSFYMSMTGTDTLILCGGHIYDNGGPEDDYGLNCNSTLVVMPDAPGMIVQLQGTYAVESGYDYLRIYDGSNNLGTLLFESSSESGTVPLVESTTGPLTIVFTSDYMICDEGFDLAVSCAPAPTCIKPYQFTVDGTTDSSVTLSWVERGNATAWDIEYGTQGFVPGQGTMVVATTNPFTIGNLVMNTTYDFYVRANCGGGDESDWVGPVSGTPGVFVMPTIGQYSVSMCGGTICDDGGPSDNYSDDCDVLLVVNPDTPGMFVRLTGTINIESYDWFVIFDGNNTDGNVLFDSDNSTNIDVVSTTGPLTIYFESDGSVTYSGFEIQVSCESGQTPPVQTCNTPTNVTVGNVTANSAVVDWTQEGTPDSWTVSYKKGSVNTWTTANTTTHPYTITNLEPETSYTVFVKANCGDATSEQSAQVSFITGVGVNNYELDNTLVYPNPTTGKFRIENSEFRIESVEVYDVYGKLLQAVEVRDNSVELDASAYASGMYFVRVMCDEGIVTKSIIKK